MFGMRRLVARLRNQGRHGGVADALWQHAALRTPYYQWLDHRDRKHLRELTGLFLRRKYFEGAGGLTVSDEMRVSIALQACVPILKLGLDYYAGWNTIIVYPGDFRARHEHFDEAGVLHSSTAEQSGESWQRGPVILSWPAVEAAGTGPYNVVYHECAHKLDMLNGVADGFPPLHPDMQPMVWSRDFHAAYRQFCRAVDRDHPIRLDEYAATDPGEFFATLSEAFFQTPAVVHDDFPPVYQQLRLFYRQDSYALFRKHDDPAA